MRDELKRPGWDDYYMGIAHAVAARSNCVRRSVGALIVVGKSIISTGYNGSPMGVRNCSDGGCPRCASDAAPGVGYDTCICVHAEQNAFLFAARHGNATEGGTLYTTLRPCFGCAKEAIQAGIREIVFAGTEEYEAELEEGYRQLIAESGLFFRHCRSDALSVPVDPRPAPSVR
ncbi:MAG TPA: dCMP deaminase family protein [Acidobacteriota bacterium]|nr:dCMP deaminase family protein [Acidobacteriota bacterium]